MIVNKNEQYIVGPYNVFTIYEPKERKIVSQSMQDKIVNHLVARFILYPALLPCLLDFNVASIKNKGMRYGLELYQKYRNYYSSKYKTYYILKCDISKFFASIDHDRMKEKLIRKIKDKRALQIIFNIIDSDEEGLSIGNMTSQVLAVFYLNELDHYVWEKLNVKYIRYMDDGVLLSTDKEYLKECLKVIKQFMDKYNLKLNNKTHISNVNKNGLDFLVFRFYVINNKVVMKLRTTVKRRLKRKMRRIRHNKFSEKKTESILASYRGHLKWGNCYNLSKRNGL